MSANQRNHPHQKPRNLIKTLVETTTEKGELIIDPCAGSFIVLEVCQELGREFLGCDFTYQATQKFIKKTPKISDEVCLDCFEFI